MKPFNLEEAKAGKPVITRCRYKVRLVCFDRKGTCPLAGLIDVSEESEELYETFRLDGRFLHDGNDHRYDLFMAPIKKEGWINIYPNRCSSSMYNTEKEALEARGYYCVATIKIEWEE